MDELLVLSLLIEEYKLDNDCISLPEQFEYLSVEEKMYIIKKALEENKKIEDIIDEKN